MKPCSFPDCGNEARSLGLCRSHYTQHYNGRPLRPIGEDRRIPLAERFWPKVDRRGPTECWEWRAGKQPSGYGTVRDEGGASVLAHRVAYELSIGPIPAGLFIDHVCHNKGCVNPRHLQVVTRKQNAENSLLRRDNKTGISGVTPYRGRWKAGVRHHGRKLHIGYFSTLEEARDAVIAKRNELFTNNLLDRKPS